MAACEERNRMLIDDPNKGGQWNSQTESKLTFLDTVLFALTVAVRSRCHPLDALVKVVLGRSTLLGLFALCRRMPR